MKTGLVSHDTDGGPHQTPEAAFETGGVARDWSTVEREVHLGRRRPPSGRVDDVPRGPIAEHQTLQE